VKLALDKTGRNLAARQIACPALTLEIFQRPVGGGNGHGRCCFTWKGCGMLPAEFITMIDINVIGTKDRMGIGIA
jgi:hypothetical protein